MDGPNPPQVQTIKPLFPRVQTWPIRAMNRYLPKRKHRLVLLLSFYFCWLLAFVSILHHSAFSGEIQEYGKPLRLSCLASYWYGVSLLPASSHGTRLNGNRSRGNGCGLHGNDCRPFDNSSLAFNCPANCRSVKVLNPYAVGTQEVIYQQLVVGGGVEGGLDSAAEKAYRGDSFICAAAIHAGVVRNDKGGCGVLRLVGRRDRFDASSRNGIRSIGFDSAFPLSFEFDPHVTSECKDLRWPLLAVSVFFTALTSLFITSPALLFGTVFVGIYFHVGLASDPPNLSDYYAIVSLLLGRFLPATYVAFVVFRYCVKRPLEGLQAQIEKTVLWLGGCWVGALTNYTFDFIPISRLTPHDLNQQPGAKVALAIIIIVLVVIVIGQIWYIRLEGRLPRYIALYILLGVTLGLLAAIPGLDLRIHHYFLALLLLPGTAIQTRPSLLYQGLLVGLFINGIARWGFDSILQTPAALRGDGQTDSALPVIPHPLITNDNITFGWAPSSVESNQNGTYDGMSILVNDVERYRGYQDHDRPTFTWGRAADDHLPYYFRFALMQGTSTGDYTKAGVWEPDGSWREMMPGPSRR
ncbi:MAG: hypothetical protein M1816_002577 [Peltula sp. TS41687]|nr:MAG: hypothetical protein M1816_002577 [Peltula sp. TS41687]